jgi:hypothetical protein
METHTPLPPPPPLDQPQLPPVPPAAPDYASDFPSDYAADTPAYYASDFPAAATPVFELESSSPFKRFWRKYGGDGFLVSVGLHVVLIIIALTWIVSSAIIGGAGKPENFDTGAGGGDKGNQVTMQQHRIKPQRANLAKSAFKLATKTASSVSLPEMPDFQMSALTSGTLAGAASKGIGGGAGGGIGTGIGPGIGGGRNMVAFPPLFGSRDTSAPGLVGVFYDFKQTPTRRFKDPGRAPYVGLVREFMRRGWSESFVRTRFFSAPEKLMLEHVFIPLIPADEAPKAYKVEDKVKPSRWMAHYKGRVKSPMSGRFRFVGMADDWIAVRWNGKVVLDSGYDIVAQPAKHKGPPLGVADIFPSGLPHPLRCGPWNNVSKGTEYAMEVAIGETPGGVFYAYLCYETENERGKLKLFRMGSGALAPEIKNGDPRIPGVDMGGGGIFWSPIMAPQKIKR